MTYHTNEGQAISESVQDLDNGSQVTIIQKSDDPLGIARASLGGTHSGGYYIVYRGNLSDVSQMLHACLNALRAHQWKLAQDGN